jgi:uncharacterized protein
MIIGLLRIHLYLPFCESLKQKRSLIKPILARLHREFNISTAEVDLQDKWQEAIVACSLVCNDSALAHRELQNVLKYTEAHWPDLIIQDQRIETL